MEPAAIATVSATAGPDGLALHADPIEKRVRLGDKMTIAAALRQVHIERMAIVGRPSEAVMAAFLSQLDVNDANAITNMVKYVLKKSVRSYRHVMNRFQYMVRASKCIRLFWLASRFRFSNKIHRLMQQWKRDEDEARRHLLSRSKSRKMQQQQQQPAGKRPQSASAGDVAGGGSLSPSSSTRCATPLLGEDEFVLQQFISLQAPPELKRRVLLSQYHRMSRLFRSQWRAWRQKKAEVELAMQATLASSPSMRRVHSTRVLHAEATDVVAATVLQSLSDLPPEPVFKWYEGLSSLTAAERFELCLQLQLKRGAAAGARHHHHHHSAEGGEMVEDDGWIALSLAAVARHARQLEERAIAVAHHAAATSQTNGQANRSTITYLPRYDGVGSKLKQILQSPNTTGLSPLRTAMGGGGASSSVCVLGSSSTELKATCMRDLKAELPTLGQFKGDAWNLPPRAQGRPVAAVRSRSASGAGHRQHHHGSGHRTSEPHALAQLDSMAKSLCLRGILHPPCRPAEGARRTEEVERQRAALMAEAAVELSVMFRNADPKKLLQGQRFTKMLQ